jgi:hypothetical protein
MRRIALRCIAGLLGVIAVYFGAAVLGALFSSGPRSDFQTYEFGLVT